MNVRKDLQYAAKEDMAFLLQPHPISVAFWKCQIVK